MHGPQTCEHLRKHCPTRGPMGAIHLRPCPAKDSGVFEGAIGACIICT